MTRAVPPLDDAERIAFVTAARSFMGVIWRHQGRNRRGVDCAGLVMLALRAIGRDPIDCVGYPRRPYRHMLEKTIQLSFGEPMPADTDLRHGDIVVMQFALDEPHHVGIIATDHEYPTLIHAHAPDKKVVEMRLDADWRNRIVEVYR